MITKVVVLFLLGTTMASNILLEKLKSAPYDISLVPSSQYSGCPSVTEMAPLICKFMQANMDLYYKPKLFTPSTYIPPLVVEKCDTPELKMELELPGLFVAKKPLVIPQPPELPPFVIPKFEVPVIVDELPATINEPRESSDIPEMPVVNIPSAPELPAFKMSVIPEIVEQPKPYFFKEALPEINHNIIDENLIAIPHAPELPAFTMPEFPVPVVIPSGPVLPAMDNAAPPMIVENLTEEPCQNEMAAPEIDNHLFNYQSMSIPQPPELPAFVMPELKYDAPYFENKPPAQAPIYEHLAPLASIPAAPELPPAVLPEFPTKVEILSEEYHSTPTIMDKPIEEPCLTEVIPEVDYNVITYQHLPIPQAPELPPFVIPKFKVPVIVDELPATVNEPCESSDIPEMSVVNIPSAPELPAFKMPVIPEIVEQSKPYFFKEALPEINYNIIDENLVAIPHAPELPAFTMPEFPVPVVIPSGPVLPAMDKAAPPMIVENLTEEPCQNEVTAPEMDNHLFNYQSMSIPQLPELPAFVMPELTYDAPYFENKPPAQAPIYEHLAPLASIPAAPELPPAVLPELPTKVEIISEEYHSTPTITNKPIEEPCLTEVIPEVDYNVITYQRLPIPQAPELPAFVMPELPTVSFEPELSNQGYSEPLATAAPELPTTVFPEFPVNVEIPPAPALPAMDIPSSPIVIEQPADEQYNPEIDYNLIKSEPITIPAAPELPAFVMPELPVKVAEEPPMIATVPTLPLAPKLSELAAELPTFVSKPCETSGKLEVELATMPNPFDNIIIPAQPLKPNVYPFPCIYNLVMQHIVPNIASDQFRSLEKHKFSSPSFLPCS